MKLQKLTIHNIASIEDAEINFESNPLADSEVFLITGKTGSGKSTILDAICLALYGDTPRLDGTLMEGNIKENDENKAEEEKKKDDNPKETNKKVTLKDPRQLMRKNTGEAFVILNFIGSDGIHYEACWSVVRAYKKVTGKLQPKSWKLKNLDTDYTYTSDKEIKNEIFKAIGLDFKQFCRTTLLAQGEFTKFLNSKDEDKAAILEKITGMDIYSKIGMKVYEVTSEKERTWKDAQQLVENTHTLTADEILAKKKDIDDAVLQIENIKKDSDKESAKLQWIKKDALLGKEVETYTENHKQALEEVECDEFKEKETLAKQWNATIGARNWLSAMKNAEDSKALQQKSLSALKNGYANILDGFAFEEQEKDKTETAIRDLSDIIEKEKDKATVYDNAQTIVAYLNTIADGRSKIASNLVNIEKENKSLTEVLQPAFNKAKQNVTTALNDFNQQDNTIKAEEKKLEALQLNELRKDSGNAQKLQQSITTAFDRMESLNTEIKRKTDTANALKDKFSDIEKKKKESVALDPPLHDAEVKKNTCKEMLDRQSDTIDKFAKTLRQKLHVGDRCPICQQEIKSQLPHEEELAKLVKQLQEAFDKANAEYNELFDKKSHLEAEIKALEKSYNIEKDALEKDKSVETAMQKVVQACKDCGIETVDESTADTLRSLSEKTQKNAEELGKKISDGEAKEKIINGQRTVLESIRKKLEQLRETMQKAQQDCNDCNNRINTAKELVNTKKEEVANAESKVAPYITGQWTIDWKTSPTEFASDLDRLSKAYQENTRNRQTLENQLNDFTKNNQLVRDVIADIKLLMPDWEELTATGIVKLPDLLKKANELKSNADTALVQLRLAEDTANENHRKLDAFLSNNEVLSMERLTELDVYSQQKITDINSSLSESKNKVLSQKTLMEKAVAEQAEHQKTKPAMTEEDTEERLNAVLKYYENMSHEISEKKGAIQQELDANEKAESQLGKLKKDAENKKADYLKWDRLNKLIGDAKGNTFRKIAQSYVLNSLIHSANSYMKTLTDRYTLKVTPGTFIIMIEDAYQGYVSRSASTISGGESFLVSLSLALALSDIGQNLAVDTLFIDEGFGTLSGEPLQNAINTLRSLHTKSGRHVGIISHVEELRERIPVQIQVIQEGNNSSSEVKVVTA